MQGPLPPTAATKAPPAPVSITTVGPDGNPQTISLPLSRADVAALRAKREELSSQLISADGRRRKLSDQIVNTNGANRAGLEARIGVLDQRIVQLEADIAESGRQLSSAPAGLLAGTLQTSVEGALSENLVPIAVTFTIFVLTPIALAFARTLWKRAGKMTTVVQVPVESTQRLERIEQGMEAIAIEIERVSEGQRFMTRLLSEGQPALAAPQQAGQKVRAGHGDHSRT